MCRAAHTPHTERTWPRSTPPHTRCTSGWSTPRRTCSCRSRLRGRSRACRRGCTRCTAARNSQTRIRRTPVRPSPSSMRTRRPGPQCTHRARCMRRMPCSWHRSSQAGTCRTGCRSSRWRRRRCHLGRLHRSRARSARTACTCSQSSQQRRRCTLGRPSPACTSSYRRAHRSTCRARRAHSRCMRCRKSLGCTPRTSHPSSRWRTCSCRRGPRSRCHEACTTHSRCTPGRRRW